MQDSGFSALVTIAAGAALLAAGLAPERLAAQGAPKAIDTAAPPAPAPASFAEACAAAATGDRLVLVEIGAAWCAPCKAFARAVVADDSLQAALRPVVLWSVDSESNAEGRSLARRHDVRGLPTFLLFDRSGAVVDRFTGFASSREFRSQLARALQDPLPVSARVARFASQPTAADALRLARIRSAEGNVPAALEYYTRGRELDPHGGHEFEALRVAATGFAMGGAPATAVEAAAAAFLAQPAHPAAEWIACAEWMGTVAQRAKSPELAWPALRAAVDRTRTGVDSTLTARHNALLVQHALEIDRDPVRALEYKRRTLVPGFERDPRAVNAFAWWCLQNQVGLAEAQRLTRDAAALATPGRERAMLLDTAAEVAAAGGDLGRAAEFAVAAAREAPDNPYYAKQVARFRSQPAGKASQR